MSSQLKEIFGWVGILMMFLLVGAVLYGSDSASENRAGSYSSLKQNEDFAREEQGDAIGQSVSDEIVENALQKTLEIIVTDLEGVPVGYGSGFHFNGAVITNYHVIEDVVLSPESHRIFGCTSVALDTEPDCNLELSLMSGVPSMTSFPTYNANIDLAVLHIVGKYHNGTWIDWWSGPANIIMDNDSVTAPEQLSEAGVMSMTVGEDIFTIGYPDYSQGKTTVTHGRFTSWIYNNIAPLMQADMGLSFGNSGGATFDSDGELVGIVVACHVDFDEQCIDGIIIPFNTLHIWLSEYLNLKLWEWNGRTSYVAENFDELQAGNVLCLLRQNAFYDPTISRTSCTCAEGFSQTVPGGDCDMEQILTDEVTESIKSQFSDLDARTQACRQRHGTYAKASTLAMLGECLCAAGYDMNTQTQMCERVPYSENISLRKPTVDYTDRDAQCVTEMGPGGFADAVGPIVECACRDEYTLSGDFGSCLPNP